MRDLLDIINLIEAKEDEDVSSLKKAIASLLKDTEEGTVLNQVLKVLQAGNIDERIAKVVGTDADAKQFITQITDAIIKSDASIQQKNAFLDKFPKGILDANTMVDGGDHTFEELVGAGFPTELLKDLSVRLTSQGVGPGEVMGFDAQGVRSKLVGISQRRTQEAARFQCTVYLEWGSELSRQFCQLLNDTNAARAGIDSNLENSVMP